MKPVARFLIRGLEGENVASLICPLGDGLPLGVYEITETPDGYAVTRKGDTAMDTGNANWLQPDNLRCRACVALITKDEDATIGNEALQDSKADESLRAIFTSLMETKERTQEAEDHLSKLFWAIERRDLVTARELVQQARRIANELSELSRADMLIRRKQILMDSEKKE